MATFLVPHVSVPSMHGHCYNDFNIPLIELRFDVQAQQPTRAERKQFQPILRSFYFYSRLLSFMSILKVCVLCQSKKLPTPLVISVNLQILKI